MQSAHLLCGRPACLFTHRYSISIIWNGVVYYVALKTCFLPYFTPSSLVKVFWTTSLISQTFFLGTVQLYKGISAHIMCHIYSLPKRDLWHKFITNSTQQVQLQKITISVTQSRYFNETAGVAAPSEEVESFQIRCLTSKFVHAFKGNTYM